MTAAQAPARQDNCRAGRPAPPCNPATLGAECAGDCGRRLHARTWNGSKRVCADGHPTLDGHGKCPACNQAVRRADTKPRATVDWQRDAACRDTDPTVFFPHVPAGASFRTAVEHVAWRYCHGCPVRRECHEYAETTRSLGLWAGVWRRYRGTQYIATPVIPAPGEVAS